MITEDYVSYEVAKLLKEKGFVTPCNWIYCGDGTFGHKNSLWDKEMFLAPTHQMAMKWLREVHNILIWFSPVIPTPIPKDETVFYWEWKIKRKLHSYSHIQNHIKYETYEEAVEEALKYSLEKLI